MRCCRCKKEALVTTVMRSGRVVCGNCATVRDYYAGPSLDEMYRNGGRLVEDRKNGRDVLTHMAMLEGRPDWLASELKDMGVTEDGDGLPEEEREETVKR